MTDAVVAPAPPAERPRRALGATAFVLSLLAFVGDVVVLIVLVGSTVAALGSFASFFAGSDTSSFGGAAAAFVGAAIGALLGTLLALLGLILGIVAAARGRGRALGVLAIILGALVLVSRIVLVVLVATSGSGS